LTLNDGEFADVIDANAATFEFLDICPVENAGLKVLIYEGVGVQGHKFELSALLLPHPPYSLAENFVLA
jgi:hypothetical protein